MALGPARRRDTVALLELDGIARRQGFIRYDVIDPDLVAIGTLDVTMDQPPRITNDSTRRIKRTLDNVVIDPIATRDVDTASERIRPVHVLEDASEWPLGAFGFTSADRALLSTGTTLKGSLSDGCAILDQGTATTISFRPGRNLGSAMEDVAQLYGIHRFSIDATDLTVASPLVWPVGRTKGLDVLEELCTLAGFLSPYFTNDGLLVCRDTPADGELPELNYAAGGRVIADTAIETVDAQAPNRWIAVDTSATSSPKVGIYDLPETSPNSFAKRGYYVVEVVEVQGLASPAAAVRAARAAGRDATKDEPISFEAIPDFRHDTHDLVGWDGETCRELSWSYVCDPTATMDHELQRLNA